MRAGSCAATEAGRQQEGPHGLESKLALLALLALQQSELAAEEVQHFVMVE